MVDIRPLTDDLKRIAQEELNEVEARIPEDIATFRTWIEKQPHLKTPTSDQFLVAFLRGCKYSLETAKSKLDYNFTIRTMANDLFEGNVMNEKNIQFCRSGCYVRLPRPFGAGGPRMHFTDYTNFNANKFTLLDLFRYQCLLMDMQYLEDDNCIISGDIEIIDLKNMNLSMLLQFDLGMVKKLGTLAEKGTPFRIKGIHMVNVPKEAAAIINLAKSLMSEKIRERYFIHKNMEELFKHIPQEYLPVEFGGSNGSIPEIQAETEKKLLEYNKIISTYNQYGVDEKLRPGKKIDKESLFGIDGSFRKLEID